MAAAYANGSSDAFSGTNSTGKSLAMELYNYCMSQPEIPEVDMAFSNPNVTAYVEGDQQRTEEVTFLADTLQSITFKLPSGVKFHNVTTGKTSAAGASVKINGGTKFYLSAPITQAADVSATFSATMKGTIVKDYSAYKISTGGDLQDLAFVFGEAVDDEKYVDFSVTWVSQASVSIVKKDKKTNAAVAGAVYGLYSDPDCTNLIMEMPATDTNGASSVTLNKTQDMIYLKEISGPTGYLLDTAVHNIQLVVGKTFNQVVTDDEQKANLTIYKEGEVLTGANVTAEGVSFTYEKRRQKGAVYNVYAAADIKRADGTVVYKQGALVKENLTTGDDGSATLKELHLGTYRVTEMKQDAKNEATIAGAVFGIYNTEDLKNEKGEIIVKADTLLQEMTSDEDGQAVFTVDLPLGQYYVKELKAPAGFVSSDEILTFDASYQGQDIAVVKLKEVKKNQPTTVEITKSDITTGTELEGARLKILDKDGNVVDEWTSVKDQPHVIKRLVVGEEYTLREEIAPYGYLKATDIKFTLEDTAEVQKVEMKDEVPTALLIINKKGEFLDKVTLLDNAKGTVEHLFEYISGNLTEVTFEVYAAEDIKAADGISEDYYKADDLVGTITTDDTGIAQLGDLPVGKYYVKEVATAHGYVLDDEIRYVDLSYRDQDTPVVTYDEDWQNARQKVTVQVLKKEKDSDRVLKGAIFGLFTAEDIKSVSGNVLLEADEIIEQKTTDENGRITFLADLPVDGKYYVKELQAPDGFVTTEEEQEFTFEYEGEDVTDVTYEFTFENEPTTVELTKSDLTTGEELPGAHLKVTDEAGNTVDEWTSTKEAHAIKELVVGKKYKLTETKPADGFVTAESIEFTIENTAEIQKHEMKDDVTKVQISKTDITGDQEIPGAKLTILDENDQVVESWTSSDKPHYVEKLPIGKYTLREEQAPKGFILTNDVTFEVADTGEIQTVSMKDDTAKGKVIINKTDADTEKPLKGVEYELRDSKGKVLEKLVTDAAGHAESGLYEIATYKNGKFSEAIKYYLVETKTLDGYELDQTEHEIVFEYADQNTPIIEVKKDLTNKETQPGTPGTPTSGNPKTGDETNLWLPVVMMLSAAAVMAGVLVSGKRKKKQNKSEKGND